MLVVKVELCPGGQRDLTTEIGRLEIANISSPGSNLDDYQYHLLEQAKFVDDVDASGIIRQHNRQQSVWRLIQSILNQADF